MMSPVMEAFWREPGTKTHLLLRSRIKLQCWDTAGQDRKNDAAGFNLFFLLVLQFGRK